MTKKGFWKFATLVVGLVAVHLNYWMWDDTSILWGFPSNLLYHVVWSLCLSAVMWKLSGLSSELRKDTDGEMDRASTGPASAPRDES